MSPALEFRNVSFYYQKKCLFKDFSYKVQGGDLVSLVGKSGCGKTTFLRLCAGLEKPYSGEIFLRGNKVAGPDFFVKPGLRSIGYVFQNFALFEKISVKKNIFYGCKNPEHIREAERLIGLMGLQEHLDKRPDQLSGGERQRVALSRSLALKPGIMFLDEPFASLGSDQSLFLIDEIKAVFKELGVTALMVTHSKEEAARFSSMSLNFDTIKA